MADKLKLFQEKMDIPDGIELKIDKNIISVKGPKGELNRKFICPGLEIISNGKQIVMSCKRMKKKEKTIIGTFKSHIRNMFRGVNEMYVYKLKICSSHFPMTISANNGEFVVKNFFGEKIPRKLKIKDDVTIKIEGEIITVESLDKELAGQVAADIEILTRRSDYDRRIFQDGIYIIDKAGKGA